MKWLAAFILLSVSHLTVARVFRQALKRAVTPRTNYIRRESLNDSVGGRTANVTDQHLQNGFEGYLIDVALGTPPQNFTVLFDTGSPYLWVTDSRCKTSSDGGKGTSGEDYSCPREPVPGYTRRTFNDTASTTLNVTNQTDFDCSGPGCVGGRLAVDVFSTGGVQVESMTALLVDSMRHDRGNILPSIPIDGVFGAWMSESSMQHILRQINRHLFTIALSGHVGQKAGSGGGFITFGALDDVNCEPDWTYVDVDAPSPISDQWNVVVDGVTYGSYKAYENWQVHAALSTGIPRLQLPVGLVDKIASDAKGKFDQDLLVYVVDCDVAGLSDIVFIIGGRKYPIPWKDYILDLEHEPGKCVLNLDATWGVIGVGDPFYRTFCTSYDCAQKRVGFAKSLV